VVGFNQDKIRKERKEENVKDKLKRRARKNEILSRKVWRERQEGPLISS
jgi:hypothetical protein